MKNSRTCLRLLGAATAMTLLSMQSMGLDTEYSSWRDATGKGHIQYRWKKHSQEDYSSCEVEFRNLDDDDRNAYKGKIEYVHKGSDETAPLSILQFRIPGAKETNDTYGSCDRVTDVWLTNF